MYIYEISLNMHSWRSKGKCWLIPFLLIQGYRVINIWKWIKSKNSYEHIQKAFSYAFKCGTYFCWKTFTHFLFSKLMQFCVFTSYDWYPFIRTSVIPETNLNSHFFKELETNPDFIWGNLIHLSSKISQVVYYDTWAVLHQKIHKP